MFSENLDTALSKLCWSPNGQYLACGDIEGKVHLFETGEVSIVIFKLCLLAIKLNEDLPVITYTHL